MDTIILDIKDVKGNSTIKGYEDKIILTSFALGITLSIGVDSANTERTMGRPNFSEFSFSKYSDQSTTALYSACAQGTKLGDATLLIGRNENGEFMLQMKYVMKNAMISMINSSGGGEMQDAFSIHFTGVTAEYTQQNVDSSKKGTTSFGWDLAKNEAISS
ncbi:Hcp family type VI secretion system effector [Paraburkholderia saeva]|jgi:type VI secretion system secreted protein Hcp|uniref:Virulence factor secretion apparatus protein n=1 Tax=Paraburkholderia saeva TaxID=2777537 RepID=A0A9N8X3P7_9BURK|nr:type VI secretion system tube protein Hcp [Paraburkholderia saeva]CAG4890062.1 hypothetical protein R70241_00902 [Paraburkholderia saeva]CAG4897767.1 hypothetical protein R52603_02354 [Paraburkholderia saeva]CAG4912509.1 hypothetical protein LMG31841_04176 [Paraburkholderia saeva]